MRRHSFWLPALEAATLLGGLSSAADPDALPVLEADRPRSGILRAGAEAWFRIDLDAGAAWRMQAVCPVTSACLELALFNESEEQPLLESAGGLTCFPKISGELRLRLRNPGPEDTPYRLSREHYVPAADDHSDDPEGAQVVRAVAWGRLELPSDVDWFAVEVPGLSDWQFRLRSLSPGRNGLRLELFDASGLRQLNAVGVPGLGARRLFLSPRSDGRYLLRVSDADRNPEKRYALSWGPTEDDHPDGPLDLARLEIGRPLHGALETPGDTDWFKVALERGRAYRIDFSGVFEVELYDLDGITLLGRGELGTLRPIYPRTTGTYFVRVPPALAGGGYRLNVNVLNPK
jgi:hypothetical protein